ncbi:phage tail protein [Prodigiosinella confusarubida]|uniref:Phage tail protein n=1 Tax=Serratia sp. (strain ATCC 39006) TaxID=104623 RepID=A0A2I5TL68_SERS3|nr:phage tail protein [Serratia sp. ATCC 39006]AUH00988.1 phage tail protein [Serratia sp. ATCC 39006]AUH05309.1 phage tail protein [Serratia sp. ATCC 39006]
MSTKYFALLTTIGAAKLANATALGKRLAITQMAVGDGGGTLPTPDPAQTKLINEQRRAALNTLNVDSQNPNQIIAEQVIPENEGGWWIREIGLYDTDGDLVAIANCPETYKPQLQEGSGRIQTVRMILIVSNTEAVTLKIDPAVVLATRQYVDNAIIEVKAYADSQLAAHVAADNPHSQYAPINSPALTGTPTAPTPVQATNSTRIATTAFVTAATTSLSASVTSELALKLGISELVGIPLPWPQATAPTGWLKCNGQTFDTALYPILATAYPSGTLPDLRGEFIRGWDDGRGVDSGRTLLSQQSHAMQQMTGSVPGVHAQTLGAQFGGLGVLKMYHTDSTIAPAAGGGDYGGFVLEFDNNVTGINVSTENRPRNLAFNYIVRAA